MDTYTLAGQLLQRAHLWTKVAAGLEFGNFGFRTEVANHLKINKFIKSMWQVIISNSNAALEVPSLRPGESAGENRGIKRSDFFYEYGRKKDKCILQVIVHFMFFDMDVPYASNSKPNRLQKKCHCIICNGSQ